MDIADGEIGITTDFESVVLGSSPSPRAFGEGEGATSRVDGPPRQTCHLGLGSTESVIGCHIPAPHAQGEDGVTKLSDTGGSTPLGGAKYSSWPLPSPCRLCGGPTWLEDDEGSIHPCCELSRLSGAKVDADGLLVCLSCRASEVLNHEQRRRHG